jgi:hypothetical protein
MHRDRESRARCSGARSFPGLGVLGLDPSRGSGFSDSILPGARGSRTRSFPGLGVLGLDPSRGSGFSDSVLPGTRCSRARSFPGLGPSRGSDLLAARCSRARSFPGLGACLLYYYTLYFVVFQYFPLYIYHE